MTASLSRTSAAGAIGLAALLLAVFAHADVPSRLSYQGVLTSGSGAAVQDGPYNMRFRVFTEAAGTTTPVFVQVLSVQIKDGMYNVILSDQGSYTLAAAFSGAPRFMEVAVQQGANYVVMSPTQEIASVPFALTAARSLTLDGATDSILPPGAIILWQDSNICPTGFVEATEFRNLTVRGADRGGQATRIPDDAGKSCNGNSPPIDAACGTDALPYNDKLEIAEMAAHHHAMADSGDATGDDPGEFDLGGGTDTFNDGSVNSTDVGGNGDHYHPFRTVLFCKRCPLVGCP